MFSVYLSEGTALALQKGITSVCLQVDLCLHSHIRHLLSHGKYYFSYSLTRNEQRKVHVFDNTFLVLVSAAVTVVVNHSRRFNFIDIALCGLGGQYSVGLIPTASSGNTASLLLPSKDFQPITFVRIKPKLLCVY